ncbi:MAG: TolC family protein [Candidatus Rifleibacteriota bacterium]
MHTYKSSVILVLIFSFLFFFLNGVSAIDNASRSGITVEAALKLALENNPEFKALRQNIAIVDGKIFQAGRSPNPELSVEFEDFAGKGELSGTQAIKQAVGISQKILTGNKIGRRVEVEKVKKQIEVANLELKELQLRKQVLLKFFEAFFFKKLIDTETEYLEILKHNAEAVAKKVEAGESPSIDITRAQVELTTARIEQKTLVRKYHSALLELSTLWGDPAADFKLIYDNTSQPLSEEFQQNDFGTSLKNHPYSQIAELNSRLARAEKQVARSKASPDLEISAGVERSRTDDNHGYFAEVSVPLFIFDRSRGLIKSAAAEIEKAENLKNQTRLELEKEFLQLQKELLSVSEEYNNCVNVLLPGSLKALNQMQQAYDEGERELLELFDARRVYLNTRKVFVQIEGEKFKTLIELGILTGLENSIFAIETQGTPEEVNE